MRCQRILLFSENEDSIETLLKVLPRRGWYRIIPTMRITDAIHILDKGKIDLVLAELRFRSEDANTLAHMVRRHYSGINVIIYSREVNTYERAFSASHFIPEMFCNSEVMLAEIARWIRQPKEKKPPASATVKASPALAARRA